MKAKTIGLLMRTPRSRPVRSLKHFTTALLPVDGQMRAFARQGRDIWIAIAVTTGVGIGLSALGRGPSEAMITHKE